MNIELSTANLRKSCRICLLEGDVDLWTHKVKLPTCGVAIQAAEDEISGHDILFEMFERTEHALDEIAAELPLICYRCLAELVPCYRFYRKVRHANAHVKTLYREALKLETELGAEEQVEFLDEYNEERPDALKDENPRLAETKLEPEEEEELQKCAESVSISDEEKYTEAVVISDEVHCMEINLTQTKNVNENIEEEPREIRIPNEDVEEPEPQQINLPSVENVTEPKPPLALKRRIIKNPKFILTGGVTKILTNFNASASGESQKPIVPAAATPNAQQHKRQRTFREQPAQPTLENASLVVTQFIPSTLQLHAGDLFGSMEQQSGDGSRLAHGGSEQHAPLPANELRTMDYAAVEIMGAHVCDISEEDNIPLPPLAAASKFATATPHDGGDEPSAVAANAQRLVYVCQYCPQAFSASHYLITHVRKSHVCKYCTHAFNKNTDLYEHIKQAHRQHKCAICAKILSSHSNLRSHIRRMHGIQLPAQVALLDYRLPPAEAATTTAAEE